MESWFSPCLNFCKQKSKLYLFYYVYSQKLLLQRFLNNIHKWSSKGNISYFFGP